MSRSEKDMESNRLVHPRKFPFVVTVTHKVEDFIDDINWLHIAFKTIAYTYIAFILWIAWQVLPISGHWDISRQSDRVPIVYQDFSNYFGNYEGFSECNIRAADLYIPPFKDENGQHSRNPFCQNRKSLLQAMSSGGRIGFDAPYMPKDCQYRWYTTAEVCMILERFAGVIFVGDSTLQNIYNGLSIVLRQNLALGALKTWDMKQETQAECHCANQFIKQSCAQHFITFSEDSVSVTAELGGTYACDRTPHAMLQIYASPASDEVYRKFNGLVPQAPIVKYKPIPIIHSVSPSLMTQEVAMQSLLEFLRLADGSQRKTPMLWIGPSAAGHIEVKNRKGNQEIWDFDKHMEQVARDHDIEVLKMWNMTVQAESWDGINFGEKVAITQAMMVINWLSRLESN